MISQTILNRPAHKFLDLSDYGFCGERAVFDLMRVMQGHYVENFLFEFLLLHIQRGLLDLRAALVEDWSPVRSDAVIRRFRRLERRWAAKNKWTDPCTWFYALGALGHRIEVVDMDPSCESMMGLLDSLAQDYAGIDGARRGYCFVQHSLKAGGERSIELVGKARPVSVTYYPCCTEKGWYSG